MRIRASLRVTSTPEGHPGAHDRASTFVLHQHPFFAPVLFFDANEVLGVVLVGEPALRIVGGFGKAIVTALLLQPEVRPWVSRHRITGNHFVQQGFDRDKLFRRSGGNSDQPDSQRSQATDQYPSRLQDHVPCAAQTNQRGQDKSKGSGIFVFIWDWKTDSRTASWTHR